MNGDSKSFANSYHRAHPSAGVMPANGTFNQTYLAEAVSLVNSASNCGALIFMDLILIELQTAFIRCWMRTRTCSARCCAARSVMACCCCGDCTISQFIQLSDCGGPLISHTGRAELGHRPEQGELPGGTTWDQMHAFHTDWMGSINQCRVSRSSPLRLTTTARGAAVCHQSGDGMALSE